jgi:GNAT superfamily N-acetyltransferase
MRITQPAGELRFGIRRAAERDLAELGRMRAALQELIIEYDPKVLRLTDEFIAGLPDAYRRVMAKDENRIFVAADGQDRPVGMVMLRIIESGECDQRPWVSEPGRLRFGRIDDAWVEAGWRRQGVMAALVGECCRFLVARGVPMVMLDWANRNEPSVRAWTRLGFEPLMTMAFASPAAVLGRKE